MPRWRWMILGLVLTVPLGAQGFPRQEFQTFRTSLGLSVPRWDPALARSAEARALVLAETGLLSHTDDQGRSPGLQLTAEGWPPGEFGEVLGAGGDPSAVWKAWLDSPPHRLVLTAPGWTTWGAGRANVGSTTVWVVRFRAP